MKENYALQCIDRLNLTYEINEALKKNNITKIGQLCEKKETDLRGFDLTTKEIDIIIKELELLGLKLKNIT